MPWLRLISFRDRPRGGRKERRGLLEMRQFEVGTIESLRVVTQRVEEFEREPGVVPGLRAVLPARAALI